MKKILIYLLFLSFLKADMMTPDINIKSLYKKGIYDALIMLEDYITQDITIKRIKDFDNKIIIGIPTKSIPTNDLIYFSVIAKRNFFNPILGYDLKTHKGYLIFNAYTREADANYALKQLKRLNIYAYKIFNGKWVSYPIIVKNLIAMLKISNLKNMPTKVIIEKIYIKTPPKVIIKKIPVNNNQNNIIYSNQKKYTQYKTNRLKQLLTLITHIKVEGQPYIKNGQIGFFYKNKFYTKGSKINGFTITDTRKRYYFFNNRKYMKLIFRFDNYNNYHLIFRIPLQKKEIIIPPKKPVKKVEKPLNIKCDNCNPEKKYFQNKEKQNINLNKSNNNINNTTTNNTTTNNINTNNTTASTNQNNTNNIYSCDFSQIKYLNNPRDNYKLISLQDAGYNFKQISLIKLKEQKGYVLFQANSKPVYALKKSIWDYICHKL